MLSLNLDADLKPAKYAWPGGYPIYYFARLDYDRTEYPCCADCAGKAGELGLILVGQEVNYEDNELECEQCGKKIESAYGQP